MPTRSYKLRCYPTAAQAALIQRCFDHNRWVWNHALRRRSLAYRRRKESVSGVEISRALTQLKNLPRFDWLNQIPSGVITQKLRDQDRAFANFFAGRARYPRFRKRRHRKGADSIRLQLDQRCIERIYNPHQGVLRLPRLGNLKVRWSRIPTGTPKMVTVRRDACGRWFVSMSVEEPIETLPAVERKVGLDRGLSALLVSQDGWRAPNVRPLKQRLRQLKRESRRLSRKTKGSNRWHRQRQRLARVQGRVADTRRDYLHQVTMRLMHDSQVIALEDLNVRGMMGHRRLARSIADAGWHELHRQLDYKAQWYGREVIVVDRWAPTSKVCSCCGHRMDELPLSIRTWMCPSCSAEHDRDQNAAANILYLALIGQLPGEGGHLTNKDSACTARSAGPDVRGGGTTPLAPGQHRPTATAA